MVIVVHSCATQHHIYCWLLRFVMVLAKMKLDLVQHLSSLSCRQAVTKITVHYADREGMLLISTFHTPFLNSPIGLSAQFRFRYTCEIHPSKLTFIRPTPTPQYVSLPNFDVPSSLSSQIKTNPAPARCYFQLGNNASYKGDASS